MPEMSATGATIAYTVAMSIGSFTGAQTAITQLDTAFIGVNE